ncbi:MAG: hypothetical protein ABIT71_25845 [Vicinamibacteraceae bacterium]
MLSLRVTRDKRGYEHIYLIADARRRGRADSRLVYWCRMPGGLRVGREPFDPETREALERGNPDLVFDWPGLTKTLSQSLAAARWAARQERPGAGGGAPAAKGPRRAPARADGRSGDGRGSRPGSPGGRDRGRGGDGGHGRESSDE